MIGIAKRLGLAGAAAISIAAAPATVAPDPNLVAAQRSAKAAEDSATWAWWQMIFSAAGVVGLVATLWLNRRALKIAADASRDADMALAVATRNADAASRMAEVAEDTAKRQLRAYVGPGLLEIDGPRSDNSVPFNLRLTNTGQTPALNLTVRYCFKCGPSDPDPDFFAINHVPIGSKGTIGAGKEREVRNTILLNPNDAQRIRSGAGIGYLFGLVVYDDVFGTEHNTTFRYTYRPSLPAHQIIFDKAGNEMT